MNRKFSAHIAIIFVLFNAIVFLSPKITNAADRQRCTQNETCKIGEFLYNDDYTENTSSSCTITSRDPSGSLYLNAVALTQANAYYSHSFTPTTLGTYPTQLCCTVSSQLMCLDKTFEVVSAVNSGGGSSLTAADVWSYSDRSLTSFGSLVSDIWGYSTRSLTNFGDLVGDIWDGEDRTLTQSISVNTSNLATKEDIAEISKTNKENKALLQKLINQPVRPILNISNPVDINSKIKDSQNVINNLFTTAQNLKTRSQIVSTGWDRLSTNQIKSELGILEKILNDPDTKNSTSLMGHSNWLKSSWNDDIFVELSNKVDDATTKLSNVINDINKFSLSSVYNSYQNYLEVVYEIDSLIGNSLSDQDDPTVFGFLQKQTSHLANYDKNHEMLLAILSETKINNSTTKQLEEIEAQVLSQNQLKNYQEVLSDPSILNLKNVSEEQRRRNRIYRLLSLININKIISTTNSTETMRYMWLEEGSMVFRTVSINPSKSQNQDISVKFNLPPEIKKEQVISADPELKIDYDATENTLTAFADINLMPLESKTFTVEVDDVWKFNQSEIEALKKQATDLAASLKGSNVSSQGNTTKNEIISSLDKIMLRQDSTIAPEDRIKAYRESSLELLSVIEKIDSLKNLSSQAVFNKTGLGGLSGQSVAIAGIVIIALGGFIFFSYYLKTFKGFNSPTSQNNEASTPPGEHKNFQLRLSHHHHKEPKNIKARRVVGLIVVGLIGSGIFTVISALGNSYYQSKQNKKLTLQTTELIKNATQINLKVNPDSRIPIKSGPSIVSPEVLSLKTDQSLYVYKKLDGWVKVGLTQEDSGPSWWVSELYLK